jgi:hypothetical protein
MDVHGELVNELKTLRKGRGLYASRIGERVGPALREACQVVAGDDPAEIRRKLARRLDILSGALPPDLRVAVLAAFAVSPDSRLPTYQERVRWAGAALDRDPRTARRRVDEGLHQLAQLMIGSVDRVAVVAGADTGWHTTELGITLVADRTFPEAIEQRTIVSHQNDLTQLDLAVTLVAPADQAAAARSGRLDVAVVHGGTLTKHWMESSDRFAFTLSLPRPLARGDTHDFALHFRLPERELVRPHVVCVPRFPCELFDLRVRFDRDRPPPRIWLLHQVLQREVDDPVPHHQSLTPDPCGDVHLRFRDLTPSLAYGARWAY